ncbi:hypothetical protein AVEN_43753-1 [Araneus ventricosus]|uniref:Uncharacterized protein n=1 Tax=Araneus ventricosus TaxID=182803 RepID=A0A4Y2BZ92_ARAVE|nr:hypothetical protein AVEN_43753-1 [Araneus ventricosus]
MSKIECLQEYRRVRNGLVVRSRPRFWRVPGLKLDSTNDPLCMGPAGWNREESMFVTGHGPFHSYLHRFERMTIALSEKKGDPMYYATKCRCPGISKLLRSAQQVFSQACHLRELDLCVAIGLFHYERNGLPPNEENVNEWCETMQEAMQCVSNFTDKCMSPLQKELMGLLSGSEEVGKQFCERGSEIRANYLAHAECLAHGSEGEEFKTQLRNMQVVFETMFDVPFKKRIPLMCCGYRRLRESNEEMNAKRCGKESIEMIRNIMKMMIVTKLPDIVCQQFDPHSAECKEILPPSGTPPKGPKAKNKTQLGKLIDTALNCL